MADRNAEHRIDQALRSRPPGLWPFLAAGYPSIGATEVILRRMGSLSIRGVELGFPFSDPIADGPVIQNAFTHALAAGTRVADIFEMVRDVRDEVAYPIVAMVSVSIVYRMGVESFVERARSAGFDGLIVPDLALEEAPQLATCAAAAGMRLSMLIAPTTPPERQARIAKLAGGFLYYVSVQGTTGQRAALPVDLSDHVQQVRAETGLPVVVGFGISTPEHVREVCGYADGAIVGSAIVKRITDALQTGADEAQVVEQVARFVDMLCV